MRHPHDDNRLIEGFDEPYDDDLGKRAAQVREAGRAAKAEQERPERTDDLERRIAQALGIDPKETR